MCNTDANLLSFCFSPLYCHWNHFFKFLHCRWILYQPSYQGALYCSHRLNNVSIAKQFMQGERWRSSPYFILVRGTSGWPSLSGDQMELLSCHRPAASASPGNLFRSATSQAPLQIYWIIILKVLSYQSFTCPPGDSEASLKVSASSS